MKERRKLRKQLLERCCLLVATLLSCLTGILLALDHWLLAVIAFVATCCFAAVFLKCADVEFGLAGTTAMQFHVDVLLTTLASSVGIVSFLFALYLPPSYSALPVGVLVALLVLCVRSFSSLGMVFVTIVCALCQAFGNAGNPIAPATAVITVPRRLQFANAMIAIFAAGAFCIRYKRDQCTCTMLGGLLGFGISGGGLLLQKPLLSLILMTGCGFLGYCMLLWRRTKRRLPPGLKGCKFVRLDYLRKMARNGDRLRRSQELPHEAFGDPTKARYLIAVSHRWLDRYKCDLPTPEFPEGLRLRTMLGKLEMYFSLKSFGTGSGLKERFNRICSALVPDTDVLVFFDFMCLPQVGIDVKGALLERSADEKKLFDSCLPHMSVLYSMFPVLVCDEVHADSMDYLQSGWCYSEVSVAALGKQLDFLSSRVLHDLQLTQMPNELQGDALQDMKTRFEKDLQTKSFFYTKDRKVVRNIFGGFVLKAQLLNAIEQKKAPEVREVLHEIRQQGFEMLLDQPVDGRLNTLLHVMAVGVSFREATVDLLEFGANASLRNIAGDCPWQWKMFPRLSNTAAMACLTFTGTSAGGSSPKDCGSSDHHESDTFSISDETHDFPMSV